MIASHSPVHSVRSQLDETERRSGGWAGVAVQGGPNERVDLSRKSLGISAGNQYQTKKKEYKRTV